MSRIDELIQELCPEGVRLLPLTSLARIHRGLTYQKTDEDPSGDVIVLRASNVNQQSNTIDMSEVKSLRSGFQANPRTKLFAGDILLTAASGSRAHVGKVAYVFEELNAHFGGFMMALRANNQVEGRYLFHVLTSNLFRDYLDAALSTSTINNINSAILAGFDVPVPPLEIQREIVSILDKFTQLEAELEAELEARRIQYEVTRDRLLDFSGDLDLHPLSGTFTKQVLGNTPTRQLGDIVEYSRDRVPASALGAETFVGVDNLRANKMGISDSDYVPTAGWLTKFGYGSVLLGNIRPYLRKIWLSDREGGCSGDVLCFNRKAESSENISAGYLYHCLAAENFFRFNVRHSKGAKMPRGDKYALMGYPIFLPPIEVQNEIVSILDKLDALLNDITIGLPAEIAARRKQYEYYRNKLLTFKELEAA